MLGWSPTGCELISVTDVERSDVDTQTDGGVFGSSKTSIR